MTGELFALDELKLTRRDPDDKLPGLGWLHIMLKTNLLAMKSLR
jgi:hypothetical protein